MAQWIERLRTDGGISIQIKWRHDGRWQSETLTDRALATGFRSAVESAGHHWPDRWIKGEGWTAEKPPPLTVVVTFADVATGPGSYFAEQDRRMRRGKIKPYTLHRYRRDFELHVGESFAHLPFADVRTEHVTDWVDDQIDAGAAPKTIRNRHGLLSSIMKHGQMRMRLRPDNPCDLSELPESLTATAEIRQIRFFQPHEWATFRTCLAADCHLMMDVALATGLRWGELSALRVSDVTFSGTKHRQASIHIVRAWSRRAPDDQADIRYGEGETATWVLGPPKTRRTRWVAITADVAQRLETEIAGREQNEYVFHTRGGRPWRYPDFHTGRWAPATARAQQAGLTKSLTPHMLRHTTVVWSLARGVPIQVISEMIGHRSLQMTYDIYGGLINLRDPVMAQAMARAMTMPRSVSQLPR